jgi:hypothetical protein
MLIHHLVFGAFANKLLSDARGGGAIVGTRLLDQKVLELKRGWYKLFAHCLEHIDDRFPLNSMQYFRLMQVFDPSIVHGPLQREKVGNDDLTVVVANLLHILEIPLHGSGLALPEEILNSFTMFRTSNVCAELWKKTVKEYARKDDKAFDYGLIYPYYRSLIQMPELKPLALFALFVLIFPTGNAISERGCSFEAAIRIEPRTSFSASNDSV